jgi:hypothetical protein
LEDVDVLENIYQLLEQLEASYYGGQLYIFIIKEFTGVTVENMALSS